MALPLYYNVRSVMRRKGRTVMTGLGIAVAVLISILMLALAASLMTSIRATGHPLNVLVTSKGAETTEFSAVDRSAYEALRASEFVAMANELALASPELHFTTRIGTAQGLARGVLPAALGVHDQIRLTGGRFPTGSGEIMVGALVGLILGVPEDQLELGDSLHFEGEAWRIVGQFAAEGTVFESEIWGPLDAFMVATRRSELSSVVLRAKDKAALEEMLFDFETRSDVLVAVRKEIDYYASYAESFRPVQLMVYTMTTMLGLGGVFIGMNTMVASVMGRIREIGLLRTVGYRRWDIALAFLIESLVPALAGGIVACVVALGLHGFALRIPMGAFRFAVGPGELAAGLAISVGIGVLGAAWPLWRASRLKTVDANRHL